MAVQRWDLVTDGVRHRVEADTGGWRKHLRWWVDDELVAERRTAEDKVRLEPDDESSGAGTVRLRFSGLGKPRRATFYAAGDDVDAALGTGGRDLVPEPGSPADVHEAWMLEHPRRYEAQKVAGGVAAVVVPILLTLLVVRFAVHLPWPDWDLPSIPTPDLPSIPLPSIPLPSIPWPDWSLPSVPGWVAWLADKVTYVWPVVLAYVLARAEIKRRRQQAEQQTEQQTEQRRTADDETPQP